MILVIDWNRNSSVNLYRNIEIVEEIVDSIWKVKWFRNWKGKIEVVNREKFYKVEFDYWILNIYFIKKPSDFKGKPYYFKL